MESESAMSKQMIIAMKGHSSSHHSNIAHKLASFLKCPLIGEDDIIPTIEKSLPSTSYKKFSGYSNIDLIFDIVSQISTTQVNLNLNVVMNMRAFSTPLTITDWSGLQIPLGLPSSSSMAKPKEIKVVMMLGLNMLLQSALTQQYHFLWKSWLVSCYKRRERMKA
ncbi:unnamed protein product [Dovyalis caffra]|uniref:Uncharacterized protein n=1 Tax=Dovyalis caffra TaxID=77055 RepID=A0AAV1QMH3_9ROSI|nr:unnamed protein product [Dovyalis caffra]